MNIFKNNYTFIPMLLGLLIAPLSVRAANFATFEGFLGIFTDLFGLVVPIVVSLALVGFLWGVTRTMFAADDASKREEGRKIMIFGLFALFAMTAVWGLVEVLQKTFFD